MRVFTKVLALLVIVLLMSSQAHAKKLDQNVDTLIELGKQVSNAGSMLSNYVAIGTKIKFKDPIGRLKGNIEEYDSTLNLLNERYSDDATIQKSLKNSRISWKLIKDKLLSATVEPDSKTMKKEALFVYGNIHNIIAEMELMKEHLLKSATSIESVALDSAIGVSTSSHNLLMIYMMQMWGLSDATTTKDWDISVERYKKSIAVLQKSPFYKDLEFKGWLDRTETILEYIIMSFSMIDSNATPSMMYNKCKDTDENANKMALKIVATK
ncbi:MAG: hypothetical protein U9R27_06110 [Campylobacterota bacterium]|nr:hypothetical protein [Campylobacterota bacterium]